MARTKTVYKSQEIFHLWAHWTEGEGVQKARNPFGNMSFDGPTAYSYSATIGRIVTNDRGEKAYLVSTHKHSITTSGHQSMLRNAIPHGATVFHVDLSGNRYTGTEWRTYQGMLEEMAKELPELFLLAKRARFNKEWKLKKFLARQEKIGNFCAFFDLPVPAEAQPDVDMTATIERLEAEAKEQRKRQTEAHIRFQEEQAKRDAERRDIALLDLQYWLDGRSNLTRNFYLLETDYLRLSADGSKVETTRGASVPVFDVRYFASALLRQVEYCIANGAVWKPQGTNVVMKFGPYVLNGIQSDGTVVIGCHRFAANEIRRFAKALGTAQEPITTEHTARSEQLRAEHGTAREL